MSLLQAGETCWRLVAGGRVRFLLDGAAYFAALEAAIRAARRSIHLLGWGFDPRTRLSPAEGEASQVGRLLIDRAAADPDLDIRLLVWRSALPISMTQAFFPHRARAWFRGTGVRFELDDTVPLGACHHQKVVVIDDSLAFVGGADLGADRWDTPAHLDRDPGRTGPDGADHPPRHEVMAMVDGAAAAALAELFRARWAAAVRDATPATTPTREPAPWPADMAPDLEGATMAIARTVPAWRGRKAVREISRLTLAAIAEARSVIYLGNQYFAWPLAAEALAARLAEPDGPEIVLVCSAASPSYFDRLTMDRARSTALWRLRASDVFGRFHAFAPHTAGGRPVIAHAKVMVADDRLARISSANLNNRSHGFDTECELVVEAARPADRAALADLRDRLAGHWIGRTAREVAEARAEHGGLAAALHALDADGRLRPLPPRRLGLFGEFVAEFHIGDPADVSDSWRPWLRRDRMMRASRAFRAAASR